MPLWTLSADLEEVLSIAQMCVNWSRTGDPQPARRYHPHASAGSEPETHSLPAASP